MHEKEFCSWPDTGNHGRYNTGTDLIDLKACVLTRASWWRERRRPSSKLSEEPPRRPTTRAQCPRGAGWGGIGLDFVGEGAVQVARRGRRPRAFTARVVETPRIDQRAESAVAARGFTLLRGEGGHHASGKGVAGASGGAARAHTTLAPERLRSGRRRPVSCASDEQRHSGHKVPCVVRGRGGAVRYPSVRRQGAVRGGTVARVLATSGQYRIPMACGATETQRDAEGGGRGSMPPLRGNNQLADAREPHQASGDSFHKEKRNSHKVETKGSGGLLITRPGGR
jgi:hypothetical protein